MKQLPMSRAAAGLLRGLLRKAGAERDRILLIGVLSTDWQSLTFIGERHSLHFSICGDGAQHVFDRLVDGLGEAEFVIPGQIVADIALAGTPAERPDGSVGFAIEALTIAE